MFQKVLQIGKIYISCRIVIETKISSIISKSKMPNLIISEPQKTVTANKSTPKEATSTKKLSMKMRHQLKHWILM